jgi:GNAT superfamily N-acetyltransferase
VADLASFAAPAVITAVHDLADFACGEPVLDDWLRERALDNLSNAASRTYVVCTPDSMRVVGYYALTMGHLHHVGLPGSLRRNMPDPLPAVVLGRLAVDQSLQGSGLGTFLLKDAIDRTLRVIHEIPARVLIVHALSEAAATFYRRNGFVPLAADSATLLLDLKKALQLAVVEPRT